MTDAAWAAFGSIVIAVCGVVGLLVRKWKPRVRARDGYDTLVKRMGEAEQRIDTLAEERGLFRSAFRTMSDGFDALKAALERSSPTPTFTRGEQAAIDAARALRDDDALWPTKIPPDKQK